MAPLEDINGIPWDVESIYDFQFFNCPVCSFKDKSKQIFVNHATENHFGSRKYLSKIKDGSLEDVFIPSKLKQQIKSELIQEDSEPELDPVEFLPEASPIGVCNLTKVKVEVTRINHDSADDTKIEENDKDLNVECSKCSETFKNIDILQAHFKEKHNDAIFSCFACDDVFSEPSALEQHMSEYHKSKKKIDHLVKQKPSNRPKKLNSYQKPVKPSKPAETQLTCEICGKEFKYEKTFLTHRRSHDQEEKTYYCETCGKIFTNKDSFRVHRVNHENQASGTTFDCDKCDKSFFLKGKLNYHIKAVHEGIKSHVCDKCGKKFFEKKGLRIHNEEVHALERKFKCQHCEKSFTRARGLEVHMESKHTLIKKYVCQLCNKTFCSVHALNQHTENVHEHIINFECKNCGKGFYAGFNYRLHLKKCMPSRTVFS